MAANLSREGARLVIAFYICDGCGKFLYEDDPVWADENGELFHSADCTAPGSDAAE